MPRAKKSAPIEPPKWVELPHELYAQTAAELVTFSLKTVNSNAPAGGIRLGPEQALNLPYVSARTLLGAGETLALDYMANAGKTATAVKQMNQVQEGVATAPADEAARLLRTLADATAQGAQIGVDKVSLRARQLLLPRQDGYVAVTPLSAGGVSRKIYSAVRAHNERLREAPNDQQQRIPLAVFGLGGSNPQNVGSLVRDMQHPLVCFAPTENPQLNAARALHFKGLTVFLPHSLMRKFRDWCVSCRQRNGGLISTNMLTRDAEIDHIHAIARAILAQGEDARQRLLTYQHWLPAGGEPLVSAHVDPVARGLIDPTLRDKGWPRAFAEQLARRIANYRFDDGGAEFQFEQADIFEIQAMIEETVR